MSRGWLATVFILLVTSCAPPRYALQVVAWVGKQPITRSDLQRAMAGMERGDLSPSQLQQKALEQLIAQELLYQEAQRRGMEATEEEISGHLDLLWREFLSRSAFEDLRKKNGLDDETLRHQVRRELIIARLLDQEVFAKTAIGEKEMVTKPREVHELYIYRKVYPGAPPAKREKAWKKMREARDKLLAGEDFGEVAREYSQSGLARYGGDAGFVTFHPNSELSKVLFALEEGQISEIIETRWGLFILKAQEIRPETKRAYGELNPKMRRMVFQRRMQERLDEFVEELRRKTRVEMAS